MYHCISNYFLKEIYIIELSLTCTWTPWTIYKKKNRNKISKCLSFLTMYQIVDYDKFKAYICNATIITKLHCRLKADLPLTQLVSEEFHISLHISYLLSIKGYLFCLHAFTKKKTIWHFPYKVKHDIISHNTLHNIIFHQMKAKQRNWFGSKSIIN